jgi:hypothetical protein
VLLILLALVLDGVDFGYSTGGFPLSGPRSVVRTRAFPLGVVMTYTLMSFIMSLLFMTVRLNRSPPRLVERDCQQLAVPEVAACLPGCLTVGLRLGDGGLRSGLLVKPREFSQRCLLRGLRVGALDGCAFGAVIVLAPVDLARLAFQTCVESWPAGSLPTAGTD